jgi:hypothetical protein
MTIIATVLVAYKELRVLYYAMQLEHSMDHGDPCAMVELLAFAETEGFDSDWADGVATKAAKDGNFVYLDILSKKIDLSRKTDGEFTPLMLAARNGHFNAAKNLLLYGVDSTVESVDGKTALDIAIENKHPEIADLISISQSTLWTNVIQTEVLISHLQSEQDYGEKPIENYLNSATYSKLGPLHFDKPNARDNKEWFKLSESLSIGISTSTYELTWQINDVFITDVQPFLEFLY